MLKTMTVNMSKKHVLNMTKWNCSSVKVSMLDYHSGGHGFDFAAKHN